MTGRQSVPGLKGSATSDPLLGSWLVPSSPFSCQVLGVCEEQSDKLAPRPRGGLYCWDTGPFWNKPALSSAASLPFSNWGHGAHRTLDLYLAVLVGIFRSFQRWYVIVHVRHPFRVISG